MCCTPTRRHYQSVIWRHSRSSAFPRALDAVTECSQSTHPTHRWVRKPGSPLEEHFGQQAPAAQLTGAQAPAGELLGHRSPARSRAAFAPRPSGRSCWPLTASAPARQISSVKQTQSTRRDKDGTLFFECQPYLQLCTHEVHRWESESGIACGLGANSSWYGGSSTHLWASSSCVLLTLRPSEPGASTRSERHSTLRSSSSTWSRST